MTMQIYVYFQITVLVLLYNCLFGLEYSWLLVAVWVQVKSIQVMVVRV